MRKSIGRFFLIITLVMSAVVVQNVFADTIEVSGIIASISTNPNIIILEDGTEINGVRIKYLSNRYEIDLSEGVEVSVDYYEYYCLDGTIKNMATAITVGDVTVDFER